MNFNHFIWVAQNVVGQISSNFTQAEGLFTDSVSVCHLFILTERFGQHKRVTLLHADNCSNVEEVIKNSIENVDNTTVIHAYNSIVHESAANQVDINQHRQTEQRCLNALYEAGVREIKNIVLPDGAIAVSKNGEVFHINQNSMNRETALCDPKKMLIGIRPVSFFMTDTHSDNDKDVYHNRNYSSGYFTDSDLRPMRKISFQAGVVKTEQHPRYSENLNNEQNYAARFKRTEFPAPQKVNLEKIKSEDIHSAPVPSSVFYNNLTDCLRSMKLT